MAISLRISSSKELPMQASKWIGLQALLDLNEMEALLNEIAPVDFYETGCVLKKGDGCFPKEAFLNCYKGYIESLKNGTLPNPADYQKIFSTSLSATPSALYSIPIEGERHLIKIAKPVVQMQAHSVDYSSFDHKFRSMVLGGNSIPWGIQFSYPQIYLDPSTQNIIQTKTESESPNSKLFALIQKWIRGHTIPTPFIINGALQNVPIRLGKNCLSWINNHPQLIAKEIKVKML